MKIYLDGCDGSGKSTLAKYLADRFNLDIFCLTKNSEKSKMRYIDIGLSLDNVVHDRTFFSEVVYPKIFCRDEWINELLNKNEAMVYKVKTQGELDLIKCLFEYIPTLLELNS